MSRRAGGGPDDWDRVEALFKTAVELPESAWPQFLERRCDGDDQVAGRVARLLERHAELESAGALGGGVFLEALDPTEAAALVDAADPELRPGDTVGRYRIERTLGRGGAGVVHLAHDPLLDRPVALKLLPPGSDAGPGSLDGVLDEARAASALDHPNVGTIYEVGEDEAGRAFIAMACYEGGTLRDRLRRGALPPDEAARVGLQVAEGLHAAHDRDIVHRDIKPENLVFDEGGRVRIVDFGLAGVPRESRGAGTGGVRGTPAYMSPEQLRGEPAVPRSDVWSLGVVLHEMLAGCRPTPGTPPRPLAETCPEVPDALAQLVDRCLQDDPGDRPSDAGEVAALLQGLSGHGTGPVRGGSRGWRASAIAGLAGVALLTGVAWLTGARSDGDGALGDLGRVVVAEFEAGEDGADLAQAAREALVVDLQQSGFVSVLGWPEVTRVLERMGLPPETRLGPGRALEVAERAGAGAVVGATVSRVGPQYLVSGRVVETASGLELFAVRTTGGPDGLLDAVERLSREIRGRLGEDPELLRRSRPLPEVSTASLEALRLYAGAERAATRDSELARSLIDEAIRIDPGFAMAHRLAGALATGQLRFGTAMEHLERAYELRERLPERERWHVEGLHLANVAFDFPAAAERYRLLLARHADDARAANNLGVVLHSWLADYRGGYEAFRRALEIDASVGPTLANAAPAAFLVGRRSEADSLARVAEAAGLDGFEARWRVARAFAEGEYAAAWAGCDALLADPPPPSPGADDLEVCGSMDVAAGRTTIAVQRLELVQRRYMEAGRWRNATHAAQALAAVHVMLGEVAAAADRLAQVLDAVPPQGLGEPDRFITRTNLRIQAELMGRGDLSGRVAALYPTELDADHWFTRMGEALVEAAAAVHAGDGGSALAALDRGFPEGGARPIGWRIWHEFLRGLGHEAAGDPEAAAEAFGRAADPRFHPAEALTKDRIHLPFALAALVRVEAARGDVARARTAQARLDRLWASANRAVVARY